MSIQGTIGISPIEKRDKLPIHNDDDNDNCTDDEDCVKNDDDGEKNDEEKMMARVQLRLEASVNFSQPIALLPDTRGHWFAVIVIIIIIVIVII